MTTILTPRSSITTTIIVVVAISLALSDYTMGISKVSSTVTSLFKPNNPAKPATSEPISPAFHFEYTTILGFFLQDAPGTNPGTFDNMGMNFGLIEQDYDTDKLLPANGRDLTQWQRFEHKVKVLNERAGEGVSYRLLYLGRHGNGFHNVASKFYGDNAWDCYYSTLDSDPHVPSIVYFDAHLTRLGIHQVNQTSMLWRQLLAQKIPLPQSYYSSPQTRAIQTAQLTFGPLPLPSTHPFRPLIKELLREGHGIHTCDCRSTRTYLRENFPTFEIEEGFTEKDEIYSPTLREPPGAHVVRMTQLLDDVFTHDDNTYISMSSHHGSIGAILRAVKHRPFVLQTGGAIPVLVKVEKVPGPRNDDGTGNEEWETKPACISDPMKAGLPGYKNVEEFLKELEAEVPEDGSNIAGEEAVADKADGMVQGSAQRIVN